MRCSRAVPPGAVVALLGLLMLSGCAVGPQATLCRKPAGGAVFATLLFGLAMPDDRQVSDPAFAAFAAAQIAPLFSDFTVLPGRGTWQGRAEGARVVLISAPDTDETGARLHAVRQAYKQRFDQRSVGLVTVQSCADF